MHGDQILLNFPKSSTPKIAKMKNNKKNSSPKLPTCGNA